MLHIPGRDVAAKTGTTNNKRDAWIIGYTPNLAVGAWAGNNDNRSMNEISGLIVAPIWRAFMDVALRTLPEEQFSEAPRTPDDIKPILRGVWFDASALITDTNNPDDATPTLDILNTFATAHDILYFVNKDDPRGPTPRNPESDSQFSLWEYPVSVWKSELLGALVSTSTEKDSEDE